MTKSRSCSSVSAAVFGLAERNPNWWRDEAVEVGLDGRQDRPLRSVLGAGSEHKAVIGQAGGAALDPLLHMHLKDVVERQQTDPGLPSYRIDGGVGGFMLLQPASGGPQPRHPRLRQPLAEYAAVLLDDRNGFVGQVPEAVMDEDGLVVLSDAPRVGVELARARLPEAVRG